MVLLVEAGLFARIRTARPARRSRATRRKGWWSPSCTFRTTASRRPRRRGWTPSRSGCRRCPACDPWRSPTNCRCCGRRRSNCAPPSRRDASQPVDIYTASAGFFETLGVPDRARARVSRTSDRRPWSFRKAWPRRSGRGRIRSAGCCRCLRGAAPVVGVARISRRCGWAAPTIRRVYRLRHADRAAQRHVGAVRQRCQPRARWPSAPLCAKSEPDMFVYPLPLQKPGSTRSPRISGMWRR